MWLYNTSLVPRLSVGVARLRGWRSSHTHGEPGDETNTIRDAPSKKHFFNASVLKAGAKYAFNRRRVPV